MKVIYTGPTCLGYHSAPSGFNYQFDPYVAQDVRKEDKTFFKNLINAEGSDWEKGGWKTKLKPEPEESEGGED